MARTVKAARKSPPVNAAPVSVGSNKPIHAIRYRSIKVAIWRNDGPTGVYYTATPTRSYQDEQKQWHDTNSYPADFLPTLSKALLDAHSWIAWHERKAKEAAGTHGGAS